MPRGPPTSASVRAAPTPFRVRRPAKRAYTRGVPQRHSNAQVAALAPERLQLVLELGRRITSMLDLQMLLPEACRLIADASGYDMVGINLIDPLNEQRLFQAAAHPSERLLPRSFRVPLGRGLTGWVARQAATAGNDYRASRCICPGPGVRRAPKSMSRSRSGSARSAC